MKQTLLSFIVILVVSFQSFSQTYVQDPAFAPVDLKEGVGFVQKFALQSDGKIVALGTFDLVDGKTARQLVRLHPNGQIDSTFKAKHMLFGLLLSVAVQPDEKVIVVGDFTLPFEAKRRGIARFLADGTPDAEFNTRVGAETPRIYEVVMQGTDKILITGAFESFQGHVARKIARLNLDGSVDRTFLSFTSFISNASPSSIGALVVQADGKIVITGEFQALSGLPRQRVARLNKDGGVDESFIAVTRTNLVPRFIALQADQRIVICGYNQSFSGPTQAIERLTTSGSTDYSFTVNELQHYDFIEGLTIQPDGKIVVGAFYDNYINLFQKGRLLRINPDGTIDNDFTMPSGTQAFSTQTIAFKNNKLLVAGGYYGLKPGLFQLNSDGSLDNEFTFTSVRAGVLTNIAVTSEGNILGAGYNMLLSANGSVGKSFFRTTTAGIVDAGFDAPSRTSSPIPLPNGQLIVIKDETQLLRLHTNGSIDNTFTTEKSNQFITNVALQKDGKIIVCRRYHDSSGLPMGSLTRLNADGNLDNTFNAGLFSKDIKTLLITPDGKLIVVGLEYPKSGQLIAGIYQFNATGGLENSFTAAVGEVDFNYSLAVQPDGKILLGGSFSKLGEHAISYLTRFNTDLTLDATFKAGREIKLNGGVLGIISQPDGKILIRGAFTGIDNVAYSGYARLEADGRVDTGFSLDTDKSERVNALALQPDGKLLVSFAGKLIRFTLPVEQTLVFADIADKQVSDSPFPITATASSGLPVTFTLVSGPATLAGNVVTLSGEAGTVKIRASQEGNKYYRSASPVEKSFTVQGALANEPSLVDQVVLSPNPATKRFKIELNTPLPVSDVYLLNAQGQLVPFTMTKHTTELFIETSVPVGMYLVRVRFNDKEVTKKMILQ